MARQIISVDLLPVSATQSNTTTAAEGGRTFIRRDVHGTPAAFTEYEFPIDVGTYPLGVNLLSVHFPGFFNRLQDPATDQRRVELRLRAMQSGGATTGFLVEESLDLGAFYIDPGGSVNLRIDWPGTVFPAPLDYSLAGGINDHIGHVLLDDLIPTPAPLDKGGSGRVLSVGPTP